MNYINTTKLKNIKEVIKHFNNGDILYAGNNNEYGFKFSRPVDVRTTYNQMYEYFKTKLGNKNNFFKLCMTPIPILAETFTKTLRQKYFANNGQFWDKRAGNQTVYNAICDHYLWKPQSIAFKTGYFKGLFYDFDMMSAFTNITIMFGRMQLDTIDYNTGEIIPGNIKFIDNIGLEELQKILSDDTHGIIGIDNAIIKHSAIRQLVCKRQKTRSKTFPCSHPTETIYISLSVLRVLLKYKLIAQDDKPLTIKHGIYIQRDEESSKNMKLDVEKQLKELAAAFKNKQPGFIKLFRNISLFGLICGNYDEKHPDARNGKFLRLHGFMVHGMMQAILLEMTLECRKLPHLEIYAHSIDGFILSSQEECNIKEVENIWNNLDSVEPIYKLFGNTIKLKRGGLNLFQPEAGFALTQYPTPHPYERHMCKEIISYKYICRRKAKGKTNNKIITMILTNQNIYRDHDYGKRLQFSKETLGLNVSVQNRMIEKYVNILDTAIESDTRQLRTFKISDKSVLDDKETTKWNRIINKVRKLKCIRDLERHNMETLSELIGGMCNHTITKNELEIVELLYSKLNNPSRKLRSIDKRLFDIITECSTPCKMDDMGNQFCPITGTLYTFINTPTSPISIQTRYGIQYLDLVQFKTFGKAVVFEFKQGTKEAKQYPSGAFIININYSDDVLFRYETMYDKFRYIFYDGVYKLKASQDMYMLRYYYALQGKLLKHEVFVDDYIKTFNKFVESVKSVLGLSTNLNKVFVDLSTTHKEKSLNFVQYHKFISKAEYCNDTTKYPLNMSPHVYFFITYIKSNKIDLTKLKGLDKLKRLKTLPIKILCLCNLDKTALEEEFRAEIRGDIIKPYMHASKYSIFRKYNYTMALSQSTLEEDTIKKLTDHVKDAIEKLNY